MEIESELFLFLSVDIVGSTSFKNIRSLNDVTQPWLKVFDFFYREFKTFFIRNISKVFKKENINDIIERVVLWKSLGDELIFFVKIKNINEVPNCVVSFANGANEYKQQIQTTAKKLSLKCTAWLAGTPVINAKITSDNIIDFIGPSMDAGFRLSKYATPEKFILSLELAYILSSAVNCKDDDPDDITWSTSKYLKQLFFLGNEQLKGVIGDVPYPIFYLSEKEKVLDAYNTMLHIEPVDCSSALAYIEAFIEEIAIPYSMCKPYLIGCSKHGNMPEPHERTVQYLIEQDRKEYTSNSESTEEKESGTFRRLKNVLDE